MFVFKKMFGKSRGWTSRERRRGRTGAERPQRKKRPNNPLTGGRRYYHQHHLSLSFSLRPNQTWSLSKKKYPSKIPTFLSFTREKRVNRGLFLAKIENLG